jgi:hypothetical protein
MLQNGTAGKHLTETRNNGNQDNTKKCRPKSLYTENSPAGNHVFGKISRPKSITFLETPKHAFETHTSNNIADVAGWTSRFWNNWAAGHHVFGKSCRPKSRVWKKLVGQSCV